MKIYFTRIQIGEGSVSIKELEFEATKTATGYKVNKESTFGGKTTLVKEAQIMQVDSYLRTDIISPIDGFVWFLNEEESPEVKQLILNKLYARSIQAKQQAENIFITIDKYLPTL